MSEVLLIQMVGEHMMDWLIYDLRNITEYTIERMSLQDERNILTELNLFGVLPKEDYRSLMG